MAIRVLNSVRFFKAEKSPILFEWKKRLNDCRLLYTSNYNSGGGSGGYNTRISFDLCSSGFFSFAEESSTTMYTEFANGNSSSQDSGQGNWDIVSQGDGAALHLKFSDGRVWDYTLTMQNNLVHLNGRRYFRAYAGEEYGPACN